jgi:hypothetical protein
MHHITGRSLVTTDLDFAMQVARRSFSAIRPEAKLTALCMVALIVSRYPPGDRQEEVEDELAACIAETPLTPDELEVVRRFRADGLGYEEDPQNSGNSFRPSLRRSP